MFIIIINFPYELCLQFAPPAIFQMSINVQLSPRLTILESITLHFRHPKSITNWLHIVQRRHVRDEVPNSRVIDVHLKVVFASAKFEVMVASLLA